MPKTLGRLKLYIAEEQQILREAYRSFFLPQENIEVLGCSDDTGGDVLAVAASTLKPDVMLVGFKGLQPATIEKLELIRESCPDVGLVILSAFYDVKGIKALREFVRDTSVGCAYLLKHTIDTVEQLTQIICSVAEGRIILDPAIMEELIGSADSKPSLLRDLTRKEIEVLSWMARGYRNSTIAEVMFVEPKTVERHINGIYAKLEDDSDSNHARVHAIILYLRATGLLSPGDSDRD